ncbi:hypothetical protein MTO96_049426 [Rhipicephalus appendiculatus]
MSQQATRAREVARLAKRSRRPHRCNGGDGGSSEVAELRLERHARSPPGDSWLAHSGEEEKRPVWETGEGGSKAQKYTRRTRYAPPQLRLRNGRD